MRFNVDHSKAFPQNVPFCLGGRTPDENTQRGDRGLDLPPPALIAQPDGTCEVTDRQAGGVARVS